MFERLYLTCKGVEVFVVHQKKFFCITAFLCPSTLFHMLLQVWMWFSMSDQFWCHNVQSNGFSPMHTNVGTFDESFMKAHIFEDLQKHLHGQVIDSHSLHTGIFLTHFIQKWILSKKALLWYSSNPSEEIWRSLFLISTPANFHVVIFRVTIRFLKNAQKMAKNARFFPNTQM